jgi:hypothetical protein
MKKSYIFLLFILSFFKTTLGQAPQFGLQQDKGLLELSDITEASGIAASRKNIGVLWIHNDSGDTARIFAVNTHGKHLGVYYIDGITNRDWEDIAVGPGPVSGENYIYIAETGDNDAIYDMKCIYRFQEPNIDLKQTPLTAAIKNIDIIKFRYSDGPRDAETILVDPLTRDIYIVSKREEKVKVYAATYPQSLRDTIIIKDVLTLPITEIVGGDISHDGKEILLKTYDTVYYWKRNAGQSVTQSLSNSYYTLPYLREPQGEAICWSYNADGFYTTSEEAMEIQAHLYFYPRKR